MARRARPNGQQLFNGYPFYALQEQQRQQMAAAIAEVDPELLRTADVEELTRQFADRFALEAPTLIQGALSISVEETQVDVAGDFRFGAFGSEPSYVPGYTSNTVCPTPASGKSFVARRALGISACVPSSLAKMN